MNKLRQLICILTFALPSTIFAYNGYYIAGKVGIFQADFNNRYLDQTDVIPQNIAQLASQRGYTGGIAVSYRQDFASQYWLGAELSTSLDGNKALFQSGASTTAFSDAARVRYHTDLLAVSGIKLSECVSSYLKLGLSLAVIHDGLTSPVGFIPIFTGYHSSKSYFGFAAGLALEKAITNTISIFTEADYHDYGSVKFKSFQNFSAAYTHKSHIYTYDVVVGTSYQFA